MKTTGDPKVLTVGQIATMYALSHQTVYNLIQRGEIGPIIRAGNSIRVPKEVVDAWEARNRANWAAAYGAAS